MDPLTLCRSIDVALAAHPGPGPLVVAVDLPAPAIAAIWLGAHRGGTWVLLVDHRVDEQVVSRHRAAYGLLQAAGISAWDAPQPSHSAPTPAGGRLRRLVAGGLALWAAASDEYGLACVAIL